MGGYQSKHQIHHRRHTRHSVTIQDPADKEATTKSPTPTLTKNDISVIRSDFDWLHDNNELHNIGESIYQSMFSIDPAIRSAFRTFGHLDGKSLLANATFQLRVDSFINSIGIMVQNIDNRAYLLTYLHQLGVAHRSFAAIRREHMDAVELALNAVFLKRLNKRYGSKSKSKSKPAKPRVSSLAKEPVLGHSPDTPSIIAWRKLFKLITVKMYDGYEGVD